MRHFTSIRTAVTTTCAAPASSRQGRRSGNQQLQRGPRTADGSSGGRRGRPAPDLLQNQARSASSKAGRVLMERLNKAVVDVEDQLAELQPYTEVLLQRMSAPQEPGKSTRGRGAKKGAAVELLDCYRRVFRLAVDLEFQEEWQESEERLKSWSRARLESEGLALFDLFAAPDGRLFKDAVVKLFVPNLPLPYHALSSGDIVLLSKGAPSEDSFEAVVVDSSSRWLRAALPAQIASAVQGPGWRIDLYANPVAYERCTAALDQFTRPSADGTTPHGNQHLQLLKLLAGVGPAALPIEAQASVTPPWLQGSAGNERGKLARAALARHADSLNASQQSAVAASLSRSLTLWQGPPGTGKTRTLLRFVAAAVAGLPRGAQVLATAASNVAVDNLVAGLLELDIPVVRVGQPVKVAPELHAVTLQARIECTPQGQQARALREQAARSSSSGSISGGGGRARGSSGNGSSSARGGSGSRAGGGGNSAAAALWQRAEELEAEAARLVLDKATVIAATCVGAGDPILDGRSYAVCVLDEATQATEPHSLVAITRSVQSLVLVGDPQQLPPTVRSRPAERLGLGSSLFVRLQAMGVRPLLLDTQYRMHPRICEFPSAQFYNGKLKSHPAPEDRPPPQGVNWPNAKVPVLFVNVQGREMRTSANTDGAVGYSYHNRQEAEVVLQQLQRLMTELEPSDVGIITPYNGQVRLLMEMLQSMLGTGRGRSNRGNASQAGKTAVTGEKLVSEDVGLSSAVVNGSAAANSTRSGRKGSSSRTMRGEGLPRERDLDRPEIKSVDGFQGREKEVIIFSAVRSNDASRVGFLADHRRLNVAITRARRGLVVVGNRRTLSADATWRAWLSWADRMGVCVHAS